ncbi:LysR family transcriptional regulator [Pseudomonas sp. CW003PS]|nr:LysR family transcriptional regulator [Pseudomonas sp. CW003PS]
MHRLNLDHLHCFSLVIGHGSFSAAAEILNLSQPAVSQQIRQLEQRLNLRLVERVARRCKPTAAGTVLLEHMTRIDSAVESTLQAMHHHAEGIAGQITIGTGATACIHLLPQMLRDLRLRFPALDVRVGTGNTDEFVRAVEDNRLDLALVTLPVASKRLEVTPILQDEFVAIFAEGSPLATQIPSPVLLAEQPLVLFESGSSTRLLIDDWFVQAGLACKPIMQLGSIEAIKEMVAAGLGCSIVPRMAISAPHHRRGLSVQTLEPALTRSLAILLRQDKPLSRGLQQVIAALKALA